MTHYFGFLYACIITIIHFIHSVLFKILKDALDNRLKRSIGNEKVKDPSYSGFVALDQ